MSLARLGALALRGATPPGMARLPLAPAFDPLAALDAATPMPAAASPGMRRQSAVPLLATPRHAQMPAPPAMTPLAAIPLGGQAPPRIVAPVVTPAAPQIVTDAVAPGAVAPDALALNADPGPRAPARPAAMATGPLAVQSTAPQPLGQSVPTLAVVNGPSLPAESRPVPQPVQPGPTPPAIQPAASHARPTSQPDLPPPTLPAPTTASTPPEVHIGRIEVVMAPPPPAPAPARPAPAAPPRDFARYAAMRGLRDRRW